MAYSTSGTDTGGGKSGSHSLVGGNGGTLTGTSGIDEITYGMAFSTVTISHSTSAGKAAADTWSIEYLNGHSSGKSGTSGMGRGTDILVGIERMSFSDGTHVALDVTKWQDSAGAALALSYAGLGGMPDGKTLGQWIYAADNAGSKSHSIDHTAPTSIDPEARIEAVAKAMIDYYAPQGISNATLVDVLFSNVVGRAPGAAEQSLFTDGLDKGVYSQASLFALAAENGSNAEHYIGLTGQGVVYTPYSGKSG